MQQFEQLCLFRSGIGALERVPFGLRDRRLQIGDVDRKDPGRRFAPGSERRHAHERDQNGPQDDERAAQKAVASRNGDAAVGRWVAPGHKDADANRRGGQDDREGIDQLVKIVGGQKADMVARGSPP